MSLLRKGTIARRGAAPYIFFDHFGGDALNLNKWIVSEGDVGVSDSQLVLTGTTGTRGRIDGLTQFSPNVAICARSCCSAEKNFIQLISARAGLGIVNSIILYWWEGWRFRTANPDGAFELVGVSLESPTEFHEYKIAWESGKATLYQDDVLKSTNTIRVPTVPLVYYYRESSVVGGDVYVDWVSVKKI